MMLDCLHGLTVDRVFCHTSFLRPTASRCPHMSPQFIDDYHNTVCQNTDTDITLTHSSHSHQNKLTST